MKIKVIILAMSSELFAAGLSWGGGCQAEAQPVARPADAVIKPDRQLRVPPPQVRTWRQMEAARPWRRPPRASPPEHTFPAHYR